MKSGFTSIISFIILSDKASVLYFFPSRLIKSILLNNILGIFFFIWSYVVGKIPHGFPIKIFQIPFRVKSGSPT